MKSEDTLQKKLSYIGLLKKLWPFVKKQPRGLFLALAYILGFVSLSRVLPLLFGYAIDQGFKSANLWLIYRVAAVYFLIDMMRLGLSYLQNAQIVRLSNTVLFDLREKVLLHVLRLPMSYFDKNASGRIMTRVTTDVQNLGELFTDTFTAFFVSFIEMGSVVVALSFLSWKLTFLCLIVVPVMLAVTIWISSQLREKFAESKRKLATLNAFAAETLSGLRIVHLFDIQNLRRQKFKTVSEDYRELQLQTVRLFAALWPVLDSFTTASVVSALFFGAIAYESLGLSVGSLAAFILLIQSFFKPMRTVFERYNQLQNSLASGDRVFDLFSQTEESGTPFLTSVVQPLRGEIEYRNVTFRYNVESAAALTGVSLKIRSGERVAFVGRTGSGKTTMISLLQKFYPVEMGEIYVDKIPITQFTTHELRSRFGVVLQDPFLFRGTLRENVTLHRTDIADERILKSLYDVGLGNLLGRNFSQGLDFTIEEHGANLSSGERQLVAFARLLAFDPDVLILDEATSHIDSISEERIQSAIASVTRGRTSLIIAHRLSTIINCDKIVFMDGGFVTEIGTHEQLLEMGGRYAELYRTQTNTALTIPVEAFSDL